MRNILQFPITADEATEVLGRKIADIDEIMSIGGIDGLVLRKVQEFIKANKETFENFSKS